jgi:hypothetical protein
MIISIVNHTNGLIEDAELHTAIRAINRQVAEDFEPYWSFGARLRLEGRTGNQPKKQNLTDMRGDAVIYLWDQVDVDGALGYHDQNAKGIPFGFVFPTLSERLHEPWSATLSHEALETIGDAQANLLVQGPHPANPARTVFHWFEMCDAVQNETYKVDGVTVSNFVLPLYFTLEEQEGGRNDFLGVKYGNKTLASFGVNPGGYVGFFDPEKGDHDTYSMLGDARAAERRGFKQRSRAGRSFTARRSAATARPAVGLR